MKYLEGFCRPESEVSDAVIGVAVGYCFAFVPKRAVMDIPMRPAENIVFNGRVWRLHRGATFNDSRRLDELMDLFGEFRISEFEE